MNIFNLFKFSFDWLKKQLNSDARITKIESKIDQLNNDVNITINKDINRLDNQINNRVNDIKLYHIMPMLHEINKLNLTINNLSSRNETNQSEILQVIQTIEPLIKRWVEEMLVHKSKAEAAELQENLINFQITIDSLKKTQKRTQACKEAAAWLANQRKNLIKQASDFIFNYDKWKENNENIDLSQKRKKLSKEIDICLELLSHYLSVGREPTVLLTRIMNYTLEEVNIYFKIYKFMSKNIIYENLSSEAILEFKCYFDEYLIKPLSKKTNN